MIDDARSNEAVEVRARELLARALRALGYEADADALYAHRGTLLIDREAALRAIAHALSSPAAPDSELTKWRSDAHEKLAKKTSAALLKVRDSQIALSDEQVAVAFEPLCDVLAHVPDLIADLLASPAAPRQGDMGGEVARALEMDAALIRSLLNAVGVYVQQLNQPTPEAEVMHLHTIVERAGRSWGPLERLETAALANIDKLQPPCPRCNGTREIVKDFGHPPVPCPDCGEMGR